MKPDQPTRQSSELPPIPESAVHVGEATDDREGRFFPCEKCGADLRFHIGQQTLHCEYCGHDKVIELDSEAEIQERDYESMLQQIAEWRREGAESETEGSDTKEIRCESCGGNVEFSGTLTSSECPYCASPVQLEKAHKADARRIPVDGVLPFVVTQPAAKESLARWMKSHWFAPSDFLSRGVQGQFNGVYLAFFTYDTMTFTRYDGERGEYYHETVKRGDETVKERKTRWYDANGEFQRFFDDVLILANTGFPKKFLNSLRPWPLEAVVPFSQELLAGHVARTYDIELPECFAEAKAEIDAALKADVTQRIGGDCQRVNSIESQYDAMTYKHLLLPVWLLAYRYNDKAYQVFVNACTGQVRGERPWSMWKILSTVVLVAAVIGGIAWAVGSR